MPTGKRDPKTARRTRQTQREEDLIKLIQPYQVPMVKQIAETYDLPISLVIDTLLKKGLDVLEAQLESGAVTPAELEQRFRKPSRN
jgi:hypothetical protein